MKTVELTQDEMDWITFILRLDMDSHKNRDWGQFALNKKQLKNLIAKIEQES